jgi:hypothetical protein
MKTMYYLGWNFTKYRHTAAVMFDSATDFDEGGRNDDDNETTE